MSGIICLLIVCIIAVLMFKNCDYEIDNYFLRAGYT